VFRPRVILYLVEQCNADFKRTVDPRSSSPHWRSDILSLAVVGSTESPRAFSCAQRELQLA